MVVVKGRPLHAFTHSGHVIRTVMVHVTLEQLGRLTDGQHLMIRLGEQLYPAESYAYVGRTPGGMRKVLRAMLGGPAGRGTPRTLDRT